MRPEKFCRVLGGVLLLVWILAGGASVCCAGQNISDEALAEEIQKSPLLEYVAQKAREVVCTGFNAGGGYESVWIRDYNTFIELSMEVFDNQIIEENLLRFFALQGENGSIVDGFIPKSRITGREYEYLSTDLEPEYVGHKNTVETDQETSLIQAVYKYVLKSGNRGFLQAKAGDKTVAQRLELCVDFLLHQRWSEKHGLLWGATTSDWGDVQHCHSWGVFLTEDTRRTLDIYDNAMFLIALDNLAELLPERAEKWKTLRKQVKANVLNVLWDEERQKFIPHIYLDGSPFPPDFDERSIYYHGGTAVAIEAGLLGREQVHVSLLQMIRNMRAAGASSIGLTVYPPYPEGFFENKIMKPYHYQNGGDWTWFGGRMIQQLIRYGFVKEAYEQALPMMHRVVKNQGFYEWYSLDNLPRGSGSFRGSAGVLRKVVEMLDCWAEKENGGNIRGERYFNHYVPGQVISFDSHGLNGLYTAAGWSIQEAAHRWTEGPRAELCFTLDDLEPGKELLLRLQAHPYLGGGLPCQTVGVLGNGEKIDEWSMSGPGWYEAIIPSRFAEAGVLNLVFTLSSPTAPSDVGESGDSRKLGMAVKALVVAYPDMKEQE